MKYLYELRWTVDGQVFRYIGTTADVKQRLRGHRSNVRCGVHSSPRVTTLWNEYGEPELVILAALEDSEARRIEDLRLQQFADSPGLLNTSRRVHPSLDPVQRELATRKILSNPKWPESHAKAMRVRSANPVWRENQRAATYEALRKSVLLELPNGAKQTFESRNEAAKWLGVSPMTLGDWLLDKTPWPGQGKRLNRSLYHLSGLTGRYLTPEEARDFKPSH